jgi:mannose-6-phosphate isomerase-like protein (cupin superfamily)
MKTLTVEKPWGKFEQFTHDELTTVKIISVNPGASLSLQTHKNRAEFWRVLAGHPTVTIGGEQIPANPGEEFHIGKTQPHRLEAKDDPVKILEIAYGVFDENDIVRLEDKYGRT